MPTGVRVCRCAQASSYSSRLLPNFGQEKTFMSHSLAALACFTARGAHCSGTQRRCTLAGRVPISRKWITCNGCALKMNPREFSSAGMPSSVARATMNGVSVDEASKSCLACWSGSLLALPGNSIDGPAVDERWMLKSNAEPSSPLTAVNLRASATRSPSVASPSVMLMTIGGNPFGCSCHHVSVILVASLSAAHIGVPPFEYVSNQTGNLTVWSITPPAPSSNFQRSEEHTSELQSRPHLVCRLLLEKKKTKSP